MHNFLKRTKVSLQVHIPNREASSNLITARKGQKIVFFNGVLLGVHTTNSMVFFEVFYFVLLSISNNALPGLFFFLPGLLLIYYVFRFCVFMGFLCVLVCVSVSVCFFRIFFPVFFYFQLPVFSNKRERKGVDLEGWEDLEGVWRGETVIRLYCMWGWSIFNLKRERCPLRYMRHTQNVFLVYVPGKPSGHLCFTWRS